MYEINQDEDIHNKWGTIFLFEYKPLTLIANVLG